MPTMPPGPAGDITFRWTEDYQETNGPDGTFVTAKLHTPWTQNNIDNFPAGMLGTSTGGANITRTLPRKHPHKDWLYCTQCDLANGIGYVTEETGDLAIKFATQSTHDTEKAVWNTTWGYLGYDVETDAFKSAIAGNGKELCRFVNRKSQSSVEALTIAGTEWKFSSDNKVIPEPTTVLLAMKELEYTWNWVPFPYRESTWDGMLGKVNSATFDGRGRGSTGTSYPSYAAGTLYFSNYEQTDPFTDPQGNICCHITFFFLYRRQEWNKFYRPGAGFVAVESADGSGRKPFETADLMTIFD